ncbi:MAG: histidine phosphatase family protein [Saccharofermentans sp.]|nr:histidine phosphatase family protein [Saccharofermentans sp.]
MRIVFIRHGEPDYEKDCLTEKGLEQATKAAVRLQKENIDVVYFSTLGRAVETAQAFCKLTGKTSRELDFMREIRYGREGALYESGHPWNSADQMIEQGMDLRDPSWREHPFFVDNTATVDSEKIAENADIWLKTLGYEREGLYYRCKREDDSQFTVAVFCHGGSTTSFLSRVLNQQFPYLCSTLHFDFTGITVLRFNRKPGSLSMPVLELVNDSRHLNTL